jgi:hypothetical protein
MKIRRLLLGFAIVLVSMAMGPLNAAVVTVHVHRHGAVSELKVAGRITAQSIGEPHQTLEFPLPAESISLPAGDWFLSAHIDGDWSEPRLVSVRDASQVADLHNYPLARLTAHLSLPSGKTPHELRAYFHSVSLENVTAPSEGSVDCQVAKGLATCQLPAGEFDLSFRIPGYVSRYRWNVALTNKSPFDAGMLTFASGSTLSGRVAIPQRRDARLDLVTVVVKPAAVPGANDEQRHRNESARLVAHPNRKGFFAFDLPPGQFTIQAFTDDLVSEEVAADVSQGQEALLRRPLELEAKRSVTVRLHPRLDPWSKPWLIELAKVDDTGFTLGERALTTSPEGLCQFLDILPGTYRLTVSRAAGQTWSVQRLDVNSDASVDVQVKAMRVKGNIRLGSKPLAASVMVRALTTGASTIFQSKADGTFLAALPVPENDTCDEVEVRAALPSLKRTLSNVRVQRHDDGTAELNLDLPSRSIIGTVVDEMGRIAAPAMVDVIAPDGTLQQVDSPDGSFSVNGLDSGRYRLRAATSDRESIDLQDIPLSNDDDATSDAVVPVVPVGHLRGVIQALDGPAMGAVVYATRPSDRTRPIILTRVDPEGHFDIRFPAATAEVMVGINAPGFAFRLTKTHLDDKDETFAVEQNGGALSVDAPALRAARRPYLVHNGATLSALAAGFVAGASFQGDLAKRLHFQIASAEPGGYSLCWLADEPSAEAAPPCVSGILAPHGQLTLTDEPSGAGTKSD